MRNATLIAAALLLGACSIDLNPISEPPPTRIAKVDGDADSIELSRGVALAVACVDSCDGPCKDDAVEAADPSVLLVRKAYHVAGAESGSGVHNPATYVLAGVAVGTTKVTVRSSCTDRTYEVTVRE